MEAVHWVVHDPGLRCFALLRSASLCFAWLSSAVRKVSRLNMTVEILVNAAGVCRAGRVEHSTSEDMEEQIQLNVLGTSLLTRLFSRGASLGAHRYADGS